MSELVKSKRLYVHLMTTNIPQDCLQSIFIGGRPTHRAGLFCLPRSVECHYHLPDLITSSSLTVNGDALQSLGCLREQLYCQAYTVRQNRLPLYGFA